MGGDQDYSAWPPEVAPWSGRRQLLVLAVVWVVASAIIAGLGGAVALALGA